ncbi:MAG: hypothetical protein K2O84_03475 [Oscillospiraceae bacterium]|nr:hypothetical protein [Oscillospiraceae bacterium]
MIYITCGTCGTSQGYKTQADGALTLPAAEEKRLVARGVAEYVTKPIIGTTGGIATPGEGGDGSGKGDTPPEHVPGSTGLENGGDDDTADLQEGEADAPDTLDIVDGHFTIESLMELSRAEMEKLAEDMGVDTKKCRNKSDIAALLSAVEVKTDDGGEAPPDLDVGGPVV